MRCIGMDSIVDDGNEPIFIGIQACTLGIAGYSPWVRAMSYESLGGMKT